MRPASSAASTAPQQAGPEQNAAPSPGRLRAEEWGSGAPRGRALGRQGLGCGDRGCSGGPPLLLAHHLTTALSPQAFLVVECLIPIPQGCLFSANSRALPGSALQIPCSSTSTPCPNPALCAPVNTSDWGVQGRGTPLCVGLTLSCLPWTNCFTLH